MENKKTTELIDLLTKLVDEEGGTKDGFDAAYAELRKRAPFDVILKSAYETGESMEEIVEGLVEDVKKLKRHKHDDKSGDVLVRI